MARTRGCSGELNEGKRKRLCAGSSSLAVEPDRLSTLPDCLLHTIMSFMKARQVVQTSVLSKRWRHLWRSVPSLDIDHDEFKEDAYTDSDSTSNSNSDSESDSDNDSDNESDSNSDSDSDSEDVSVDDNDNDNVKEWEDFEDFAVNLMLRRNIALLDSFRLNVDMVRAPSFARRQAGGWIRRAMKHCAPDPIIQRDGLNSMSWRLKRLHLCNMILDNHFPMHVSSVCHALEDLELKYCTCEHLSITSDTLKKLVLKNCSWQTTTVIAAPMLQTLVIDGNTNRCCLRMIMMAPSVTYLFVALDVRNYLIDHSCIPIDKMPSLAKASIHLCNSIDSEFKFCGPEFELLCRVCNVTSLVLSGFGTMKLRTESTSHEFKNLRNLLLDRCDLSNGFQILGLFLQNSPNLEKLTLQHCKFSDDYKKSKGQPKTKFSSSQCGSWDVQCKNLKLTEIKYGVEDISQLVELLLRIAEKVPKNYIKLTKAD